jgi:hypothetical protein
MFRWVRVGAAAALLGVAAATPCLPVPASAATWSVSLAASATSVALGSTVTLTGTANQDVTGYYIDVDDATTGTTVGFCASGRTCQFSVTWAGAGSHTYVAYIDSDPMFEYPPCCVMATSNSVTVTWGQAITWSVSLGSSAGDAQVGSAVTLTASANASVTGTGNVIAIFDQTNGTAIGQCTNGSTCQLPVSEAAAGAHTFVAYVDADTVLEYPPCCTQAQSNTVTVRWHAQATAGMNVTFQAGGTLPTFPCPTGCTATFSGSGTGAGTAQAQSGGIDYVASFETTSGSVSGSANYTEPSTPFCPAIGSATGTVTLDGAASGSLSRSSTPAETGMVTAVTFQLSFTYQRVGATTAITITGGTATVSFTFPDTGPDYFISSVAGAGLGVFVVNPMDTANACSSPRALPFTIAGETALALT